MDSLKEQFVDVVRTLKLISDGYQITFEKHAGLYYLKSTHSEFVKLEKLLKAAERDKNPVSLLIHADTLEVLDSMD